MMRRPFSSPAIQSRLSSAGFFPMCPPRKRAKGPPCRPIIAHNAPGLQVTRAAAGLTIPARHRPPEQRMATKTKFLVGLIGDGIQGSRSPALHEAEARHHGLTLRYELIDLARGGRNLADLPRLIESAEAMGFDGLNITHPCKQAVLPLLDELSNEARAIDAVNTVVFRGGKRKGFNTDRAGFAIPFLKELNDAPKRAIVLVGAGGAGAAAAYAVLDSG